MQDMKRASLLCREIICHSNELLRIKIILDQNWRNIVGEEFYQYLSLSDIYYNNNNMNSIVVSISSNSSSGFLARYSQDLFMNRIKLYTNNNKISDIVFRHNVKTLDVHPLQKIRPSKKFKIPYKIDIELKNKSLQNALEHLKTEIQNAA